MCACVSVCVCACVRVCVCVCVCVRVWVPIRSEPINFEIAYYSTLPHSSFLANNYSFKHSQLFQYKTKNRGFEVVY